MEHHGLHSLEMAQAGTFWEAVELPSIPAENMAVSLEQKAWWMNILDDE